MGISLWKKRRILRRYGDTTYVDGYNVYSHTDYAIMVDVQEQADPQQNRENGKEAFRRLTTYGDSKIKTSKDNVLADWLWYKDRWYECIDSVLTENTWLRHYTSQFIECGTQDAPPDESEVEGGDCL